MNTYTSGFTLAGLLHDPAGAVVVDNGWKCVRSRSWRAPLHAFLLLGSVLIPPERPGLLTRGACRSYSGYTDITEPSWV
jgi:hypothetical protein